LETQIPVSALPRPSIGRITPQGVISHFFLPVAEPDASLLGVMGHQLGAITAGPDGAMWFTETGADQIGRIDADGTITEFPLPERHRMHTNPAGIVTGPDGAIWFSQPLRESLGRIDVNTHEITERYLPPPRGGIVRGNSISSGSGDALWFDDARNQGIGRLTLDGEVDTLPLPSTSDYWPESVTAGPDGSVWFLDSRGRRVMRMTPEGSVIEFPALDGFEGGMMTAGSDGALWFASPGSNTIGRITCRP
jgi:virginiamycin B lyase